MGKQTEKLKKQEKNKQFLTLQAIAICLMVIGHKGGDSKFMSFVGQWFNIYSYHMALFIFISGYFFKQESIKNIPLFIWHKIKRLAIPYFGWNLVYAIILFLLTKYKDLNYYGIQSGDIFTFKRFFITPWVDGHQYIFNLASWFVLILLITHVFYVFIRWGYEKLKFSNEWILQLFLLLLGLSAIFYSNREDFIPEIYRPFLKVLFFLPFYHFGFYYKSRLESRYTLKNGWYFFILITILYFIGIEYPWCSYNTVWLQFPINLFLPFITSFVGILFWLRVSKNIYNIIGNNKFIGYLGSNTWSIMIHHLLAFFLINLFVYYFFHPINFDKTLWKSDVWYSFPSLPVFIYWIFAILLPLLWQYLFDKIKLLIYNFIQSRNINETI